MTHTLTLSPSASSNSILQALDPMCSQSTDVSLDDDKKGLVFYNYIKILYALSIYKSSYRFHMVSINMKTIYMNYRTVFF